MHLPLIFLLGLCFIPQYSTYSVIKSKFNDHRKKIFVRSSISDPQFIQITSKLQEKIMNFRSLSSPLIEVPDIFLSIESDILSQFESFDSYLKNLISNLLLSDNTTIDVDMFVMSSLTILIIIAISSIRDTSKNLMNIDESPYPSGKYSYVDAAKYFEKKKFLALNRGIEITALSASFGFRLLIDYYKKIIFDPDVEERRANEVVQLLTKLGPTFIKVGQSLSIRTDLLRPAYIKVRAVLIV